MLKQIISGGQTGADQGFLEGARRVGIATGGTAPKLYRTEKGTEPDLLKAYGLVESPFWTYPPRTEENVMNANGTVWMGRTSSPGYQLTYKMCVKNYRKPWIENPSAIALAEFVDHYKIEVLNGAGNRESKNPGIYQLTIDLVIATFGKGDD